MLQQILRDMWVDPDILAELNETQKQTLFCKMREEQVRRWRMWDQKLSEDDSGRVKFQENSVKKNVQFLQGEDGEPWVWVMGEHPNDKSIETILAEEARQKALQQARLEAQQLRKSVEKELTQLIDYKPLDSLEQKFELSPKSVDSLEDTLQMYCSVGELRQSIDPFEPEIKILSENHIDGADMDGGRDNRVDYANENNIKMDLNKNTLNFNFIEGKKDVLQELVVCGGSGAVGSRVAAWERRVAAARATDILRGMRLRRARNLRDSEIHAHDNDHAWMEQERKAKEAEAAMREIARAAREEHRRSVIQDNIELPQTDIKPPNREAVVEWYRSKEMKRGAGLDGNGKLADWFHGLISRSDAESLLTEAPVGTFLVRLSERVWGYAVSVRASQRCKHFLVEATPKYRLLGAASAEHNTLATLVKYHQAIPITESGVEKLLVPCSRNKPLSLLQVNGDNSL